MTAIPQGEVQVLIKGLHDWVGIWEFAADARQENPGGSPEEIRNGAMSRIRALISEGLMRAGDVGEAGFEPWTEGSTSAIQRIDRAWQELGRDPNLYEVCWLANTDLGDEVANSAAAS